MSYTAEKNKTINKKIILVEYDKPVSMDKFINYEAGIWFWKLTPGIVEVESSDSTTGFYNDQNVEDYKNVRSAKVNEYNYKKVDSMADLRTQNRSFYYDSVTTKIYFHFNEWEYPLYQIINIGVVVGFCKNIDAESGAYYNNIYYDPKILSVPGIKKSKDPLFFGLLKFQSSMISFNNLDGFFDNFRDKNLYRQPVRILLGFEGLDYDEYEEIFTGYIEDFSKNFEKFTLKAQDIRKGLTKTIPVEVFTTDDYPDIDEDNENKVKPIAYGLIRNAPCVCLNENESSPSTYDFFIADAAYNDLTSVDAVYVDGDEISTGFTYSLTTGILTINEAQCSDNLSDVTVDFHGASITNGLDVIKDLLLNYTTLSYIDDNYNLTDWATATAQARDVGLYINTETKLNKVIEQICDAVDGIFFPLPDGRFSFRIYDEDREPVKRIYSHEWLDEPTTKTNAHEFLSSAKVEYNKDQANDKYLSYLNTDYEREVLARYKAYQQKEFKTILTTKADAIEKSEMIMSISKEVQDIVTRKVGFKHTDLELMDFIIGSPNTRITEDEDLGVYEIIGLSPNYNTFEITLDMKKVKDSYNPSWVARTVDDNYTGTFRKIIYGDNLYVAVGTSGGIQTSPDAKVWTAQTPDNSYSGTFLDVIYKNNLYIAVGADGEIQTSPDGETWTAQVADDSYSGTFNKIIFENDLYVAVGNSSEIQTSPDGFTWTAQTPDDSYIGTFYDIIYENYLYVVVGTDGEIQTSVDGETWTARTADDSYSGSFQRIIYGKNLYVAVGSGGEIQTSYDGVTWTARTAGDSYASHIFDIIYGNNIYIIVGADGEIQTSPDGFTWTAQTSDDSYLGIFLKINYGNNLYVAVGTGGEIQTSVDGFTWTATAADDNYTGMFYNLLYENNLHIAVGSAGEIQTYLKMT